MPSRTNSVLRLARLATGVMACAAVCLFLVARGLFVAPSAPASPFGSGTGLYLELGGLDAPQTYLARMRVLGWDEPSRHVVQARITEARLIEPIDAIERLPLGLPLFEARDLSGLLEGRDVLATVSESAASRMKDAPEALVHLVAVPGGDAVTLVVDEVVSAAGATSSSSPLAAVMSLSTYAAPPGSTVTIAGSGFGATMRDSWVTCCGARASAIAWSDTSVTFRVPTGARLAGYVGVVVGGVTSNGLYFTPFAPPRLDEITPRDGAAGTVVTFSGSGFGDDQRDGWVSFAGAPGQVVSWSDAEIRVLVPRDAIAGYAGVVAHGLSSNGVFFAPYGHPAIESVSSAHLVVGETLVIDGRNFGSSPGQVVLGGTPVPFDSWSPSRVTLTVPAGTDGGYVGVVRNGTLTSNGVYVTVAPRVAALSGWWGEPGSELVVFGSGFGDSPGAKRVTIGGSTASIESWADGEIRVRVPTGASSGYVGVGTPASCSNGIWFVVESPGHVSGVDPPSVGPGDTITLDGTGFGTSPGCVVIGGSTVCAVVQWSEGRVVARVPEGATSGYVGVVKQGVTSNGIWLDVVP